MKRETKDEIKNKVLDIVGKYFLEKANQILEDVMQKTKRNRMIDFDRHCILVFKKTGKISLSTKKIAFGDVKNVYKAILVASTKEEQMQTLKQNWRVISIPKIAFDRNKIFQTSDPDRSFQTEAEIHLPLKDHHRIDPSSLSHVHVVKSVS